MSSDAVITILTRGVTDLQGVFKLGVGAAIYFLCDRERALRSWGAEPSEGHGPRINIPNDDPFRPYRTVSTCPPGKFPVIVDWPRPGDMGCGPF